MSEIGKTDVVDAELAPVTSPGAIESLTRAEVDIQIATARRYPRSITRFRQEAVSLACLDVDVAGTTFYKLRRKNADGSLKLIEGPSVRMAEIVGMAWGNLRVQSRIVEVGEKEVVAQGVAMDLERNIAYSAEVRRRITGKDGRRYGDDMIILTCNAACAIAERNATLKVIPRSYVNQVLAEARKAAAGGAATLADRRKKLLAFWQGEGVSEAQVFQYLGVAGIEEITLAHIEDLLGLRAAIADGITTIAEVFGDARETPARRGRKPRTLDEVAAEAAGSEQPAPDELPDGDASK
jgi:hypothetical protein